MTGGSPTSGADPPPIRCSIRSVIRTFWRARARANAPDADDASGGRRYSAARYGEKRGGTKRPPAFLHTLRRRCGRCHPAVRRRRRRHGSVVGACTAAVGGALPQWGAHCRSGGRCPSGGRTAAVGAHCRSGGHCVQWLSRCLRRVQRRRRRRRRRRRARPRNAPCTRGEGGMAGFRRSWGVWRRPGGACGGRRRRCPATDQRRSAWIGVGRRRSAQRSDEQCRRCGGARAGRGGRGGVKAGWRRPDRRTGAPGSSVGVGAGGPPHAGDGGNREGRGSARLGRLARSWGRGRLCGCHPLAGI